MQCSGTLYGLVVLYLAQHQSSPPFVAPKLVSYRIEQIHHFRNGAYFDSSYSKDRKFIFYICRIRRIWPINLPTQSSVWLNVLGSSLFSNNNALNTASTRLADAIRTYPIQKTVSKSVFLRLRLDQ